MARRSARAAKAKPAASDDKGTSSRKSARASKDTKEEEQPTTPVVENSRSRRSSTAAQTAASASGSRVTRSQARGGTRSSAKETSTPTPRASSRRASTKVNYEESEDEETKQKAVEEEFDVEAEADADSGDEIEVPQKSAKQTKGAKGKSGDENVEADDSTDSPAAPTRRQRLQNKKETSGDLADVVPETSRSSRASRRKSPAASEKEPSKPTRSSRRQAAKTEVNESEEMQDEADEAKTEVNLKKRKLEEDDDEESDKPAKLQKLDEPELKEPVVEESKPESNEVEESPMEVDEPLIEKTSIGLLGDSKEAEKSDQETSAAPPVESAATMEVDKAGGKVIPETIAPTNEENAQNETIVSETKSEDKSVIQTTPVVQEENKQKVEVSKPVITITDVFNRSTEPDHNEKEIDKVEPQEKESSKAQEDIKEPLFNSVPPKENGEHFQHSPVKENREGVRQFVSTVSEDSRKSLRDKAFCVSSYNLEHYDSGFDKLLVELKSLNSKIICLQGICNEGLKNNLEMSLEKLGFQHAFIKNAQNVGLLTLYKTSEFKLDSHCSVSLSSLIQKELDKMPSPLDASDKVAINTYLEKCGHCLLTQLTAITTGHRVIIANVLMPNADISCQALQVSCLARNVLSFGDIPQVFCGTFNVAASEAAYQLLRDGYLSSEMIEYLQKCKDISLPGKENEALINLLWNSFQHSSQNLRSCYNTAVGHELNYFKEKESTPDLMWFSSDSLQVMGILDYVPPSLQTPKTRHVYLEAELAFVK